MQGSDGPETTEPKPSPSNMSPCAGCPEQPGAWQAAAEAGGAAGRGLRVRRAARRAGQPGWNAARLQGFAWTLALFSCKSAVNAMGQKDFSACRHALMELLLLLVPHDQDPTPLCQPERCCAAGLLCLPLCPWSRTGLYCESSEITLKLGKYYDVFVCF